MNKLFWGNKLDLDLTTEQKSTIIHDIYITNFYRMKLSLIILGIIEILFIIFNDLPYLLNPYSNVVWNDSRFLILHLILLTTSVIGFVIIKILTKDNKNNFKNISKFIVPILTMIILIFIAIINGLDQIKPGSVSSVFIATILIFSSVIMLKFPINFGVYLIPFLVYLGAMIVFQQNNDHFLSNIINGLIFFIAVIIISETIYNYQYEEIAKNIILKETNLKLKYMSSHDPLTGLLNRRSFGTQVNEKMKLITINKDLAALILIDIDHFKHVNDKYGHPVGDNVLKEVSTILKEHIKPSDLATRWGGEEFLIFVFQTSINDACELANDIRGAIERKVILTDQFNIQITASFGVSLLKDNLTNSFDLSYKAADTALYQAKNQGRNQVVAGSLPGE